MTQTRATRRWAGKRTRKALTAVCSTLLVVLSACSSSSETTATERAVDEPTAEDAASAPAGQADSGDSGATAGGASDGSSDGTTSGDGSDSTSWDGPEWIDYPAGYEMTYSYPVDESRGDGVIYGTVVDQAEALDGLRQVAASFEGNGYTLRLAREDYVEVFDESGAVVMLSTRQWDEPPTLDMVFLTPAEAASRGMIASLATLDARVGDESFTFRGGCTVTETGNGFVGIDDTATVAFSQREDGTQLVTIRVDTPDGAEYTSTGGDISAPDTSAFTISSGVIGNGGELLEAEFVVSCA